MTERRRPVGEQIANSLRHIERLLALPYRARTARIATYIEGAISIMPTSLTIDQSGTAVLQFTDDHGDATAPPTDANGARVTVTFSSDDAAVATVDPASGAIVPVSIGAFNLSAAVTNSDGTPTLEPDGVTPFSPAPLDLTVSISRLGLP